MKYSKHKIIALIVITGFLLFLTTLAMAVGDGNLLKRSDEETCHACHKTYKNAPSDPDAIKSHSSTDTTKWPTGWGIQGGKYGEIVCTTCHTPHDTKNIYLIREQIVAPNAPIDQFPGSTVDFRYTSGTPGGDTGYYSFADDTTCYEASYTDQTTCETNGGVWNSVLNRCNFPNITDQTSCTSAGHEWSPRTTSTRVCEVCHSKNKYHNYDSNNNILNGGDFSHNNAGDCTACHPHAAGFTPAGGACDSCHGNPPTVNTLGGPNGLAKYPDNSGTGSNNPGKHQYHATSSGLNLSCNSCHTNYTMPENTLKRIQIGFNIFGFGGGSYDGQSGVSYEGKNGTSVSNTGTRNCSNIYCHSSVQGSGGTGSPTYATPQWLDTASAQCGSCHKADGVQGDASLMDSASHTKHVSAPYSKPCSECHSGAGSGTALHVNYNINMAFVTDPHGNSGSYSQSPNTPGNGYGSCSNIYCHSIAQTNGGGTLTAGNTTQYKNVTWGSTVICGNCHAVPPNTGRHDIHANTYNFDCWVCHNNAGINKQTGIPTPNHTNKNIEISFDSTYGPSATYSQSPNPPGNGYGNCSITYCHSNGTGGTANTGDSRPISANTSPLWSATTTCGSCHGGGNLTGQPNYANGSPKANSHGKHPTDCSICHNATTNDGTTISDVTRHVNRLYDLQAKSGYSFSYTYQSTGGSCSSISCHFNGTATWGGTISCGGCHNVPPTTGAHATHTSALSALNSQYGNDQNNSTTAAYGFNCGNCHPLSLSMHGNGTIEIELYNVSSTGFKANNPSTASRTGTGANTQCSDVYCHSNGADGANRVYRQTPTWGSTFGANKCGQCHDNPPQYAGQSHYVASNFMGKEGGHLVGIHFDNIYNGVAGSGLLTAGTGNNNSHGNSTYSTTISCYICHNGVVSSTTIDTYALYNVASSAMKCSNCHTSGSTTPLQNGVIADRSLHVNATKNVAFVNAFTVKSKAQLRDGSMPAVWTRVGTYKTAGSYDTAIINSSDWNSGTKTCTTACHNNQPVTWGDTTVTCYSCHTSL